jgi:hypothetical protein
MKIQTTPEFIHKVKQIDSGRFFDLIDSVQIDNSCLKCYSFAPDVDDPRMGFRCYCIGSCPAATINQKVWSYIFWKLGEIHEQSHIHICKEEQGKINYNGWFNVG